MEKTLHPDITIASEIKPFLRWAGGKNWLVKHLQAILCNFRFKNYHEPFLGGASTFLAFKHFEGSYLSDLNEQLIKTYKAVKVDVEGVIKELKKYENTESFYYNIRQKIFDNKIKHAAQFIYLNQTSFNGIYRVNLRGVYNVPYGYRSKNFLEATNLRLVSKALKKSKLFSGDFESIKTNIKRNDLVFLDPPYTVSHNLNGFIKYNQRLFSLDDQYRLSALIDYIKSKDAYYILTNAAHSKIVEIFDKNDKMIELTRSNLIGGTNAQRGKVSEYVFTNCK